MTLRRVFIVLSLVLVSTGVAVPAQAQSGPGDAVAWGHAGMVTGQTVVAPVAPCHTERRLTASNTLTSVPNVVTFRNSKSVCTIDALGEEASVTVTGGRFVFDWLRRWGGPSIRLASYLAKCDAVPEGSESAFQFSGLSGVPGVLPQPVPANHKVTIAGGPNGRPWATVTFNEVHAPTPQNGSQTVHLMHIKIFPQGGPARGDAYIGTVFCSPVS
ncbi:hypothetical protein [Actinophytocola sp.]|uniref:hypothetical protein n=1 Tax=Actinophytocola sp. TaxID=1872138 RepID=UPI002ED5359D